ncbi:hypothetical protein XPA_005496 [Xanthoria parietina]
MGRRVGGKSRALLEILAPSLFPTILELAKRVEPQTPAEPQTRDTQPVFLATSSSFVPMKESRQSTQWQWAHCLNLVLVHQSRAPGPRTLGRRKNAVLPQPLKTCT